MGDELKRVEFGEGLLKRVELGVGLLKRVELGVCSIHWRKEQWSIGRGQQ